MVHLLTLYPQTHRLLLPDAHTQIKHANSPAAQGHGVIIRSQNSAQYPWLRSRGCWLIYRSSMWVCACRAFAYLLCHPAGSQLWAQHSGTMHLPRWIPAPDIWPIHHTRKVVMFTLRNLLGYACILVEICNLTIYSIKQELLIVKLMIQFWYQFVFLCGSRWRRRQICARLLKFRHGAMVKTS